MSDKTEPSGRGGRRPGAGRKPGYGKYGEATSNVRVPNSRLPEVEAYLESCRALLEQERAIMRRHGGEMLLPASEPARLALPLFGQKIPAGFPSPADDYIEARLDLNQLLVHNPTATFFLRVKGDSMTGAGIHDGDIIVVDRSVQAADGDIVVAAVDGELTVKRLRLKKTRTELHAENPFFAPITFKEGQELQIWGVVTNTIHPVR